MRRLCVRRMLSMAKRKAKPDLRGLYGIGALEKIEAENNRSRGQVARGPLNIFGFNLDDPAQGYNGLDIQGRKDTQQGKLIDRGVKSKAATCCDTGSCHG